MRNGLAVHVPRASYARGYQVNSVVRAITSYSITPGTGFYKIVGENRWNEKVYARFFFGKVAENVSPTRLVSARSYRSRLRSRAIHVRAALGREATVVRSAV